MASELHIQLLGGLFITQNGAPLGPFLSQKVPALLAYLAVTRRPHTREALAGLLWGDLPDADAKNNLRQALSNLRKLAEPYFTIDRDTVEFNITAPHFLDVTAFEQKAHAEKIGELQAAAALYAGDFLAGLAVREAPEFEEWALAQKARLRELALHVWQTLAQHHLARGAYRAAIEAANHLLELDNWREEAHRQLMLALARSGQRSAALAQYETCRRILQKELGVEPSAETRTLYQRIRAAGEAPKHALPAPAVPLIGRVEELKDLLARLQDPHCRLLTLIGLGGSGKTRVAQAIASQLQEAFLNGVSFVSVATASTVEQLTLAIANAVRLTATDENVAEQLLHYLAEKELLIILDNFEHLTEASANVQLLVSILERAPDVKLLLTSRERLNLQAEWIYELRPLQSEDAVAVFRFYAGPALHAHEATPAIHRVCALVGHLPLAVALAAGWAHAMNCEAIAAALETGMALLSTTMRDVPERHRSMQVVFDQAWRFLAPAEQQALAALAVFRNPFTAEAAQAVAEATPTILSTLINKSWLQRHSPQRFELHELVRQYALGQLTEAQRQAAHKRHCVFFAHLQAAREPLVRTVRQLEVFTAMRQEADDIRLMWQTAVHGQYAELLDKALHSMFWMIDVTGWHREGVQLFGAAVTRYKNQPGWAALCGRLLARQGALARLISEYELAETLLTEAEALSRAAGDVANQAYALRLLGFFPLVRGEVEAGRARLAESVRLYQTVQDLPRVADALISLGIAESRLGHFEQAAQLHREAADILSEVGDEMGLAVAHDNLGDVAYFAGDLKSAIIHYRAAVNIQRRYDDRRDLAVSLNNLASVLNELERWEEALPAAQESADLFRERGSRDGLMNALQAVAGALLGLNEVEPALRHFSEAVEIGTQLNADADLLNLLVFGAKLLQAQGQPAAAAQLLFSIKRHPAASAFTVQTATAALKALPAETVARVEKAEETWPIPQMIEALRPETAGVQPR